LFRWIAGVEDQKKTDEEDLFGCENDHRTVMKRKRKTWGLY
jgi:hypothetical protein